MAGLLAVASLTLALTPAAAPAAVSDETFTLDAHEPGARNASTPRSTNDVLPAGIRYIAIVRGTYSKWRASQWTDSCGAPEAAPIFASPGTVNGPAGLDAETAFGTIHPAGSDCESLPSHRRRGFYLRADQGPFGHQEPIGGAVSRPSADHSYSYGLVGTDQAASFRLIDKPAANSYGILSVRVRLATREDCAAEGWRSLLFTGQAACEAFFDSGANTPPAETPGGPTDDTTGPIGGRFKISRRAVKLSRGGNLGVRVSCRSPRPCRGKLDLRTAKRIAGVAKGTPLGSSAVFDIPPRTRSVILRVRLSRKERKFVSAARTVPVQALAQVTLGNAASGSTHRRFRLHRAAR